MRAFLIACACGLLAGLILGRLLTADYTTRPHGQPVPSYQP